MRAILDVHPDVRCGEETRVIPRVLMSRKQIKSSKNIKGTDISHSYKIQNRKFRLGYG